MGTVPSLAVGKNIESHGFAVYIPPVAAKGSDSTDRMVSIVIKRVMGCSGDWLKPRDR